MRPYKSKIDVVSILSRYGFTRDPSNKDDVGAFMLVEASNGLLKKERVFQRCFP